MSLSLFLAAGQKSQLRSPKLGSAAEVGSSWMQPGPILRPYYTLEGEAVYCSCTESEADVANEEVNKLRAELALLRKELAEKKEPEKVEKAKEESSQGLDIVKKMEAMLRAGRAMQEG